MWPWRAHVAAVLGSLLSAFSSPSAAWSSPLEDPTLGGAVFTGPAHPHATAFFINPAALGVDTLGTHIYLGGSLRLDQFNIARRPITDPAVGPEPGPSVSAATLSPGGTLAVYNVGSKVSVGASLGIPMTETFIEDQPALGHHVLGGHHRQISWVTLAASFRFTSRILVGAGLAISSTELKLSFARDTALDAGEAGLVSDCGGEPCGIEHPDAAETYTIDVNTPSLLATQALSLSAGVVYQVSQDWWLGVGLRSPAGLRSPVALKGTASVVRSPRDRRAGAGDYTANAEVVYKLPQAVAIGLRGPISHQYELIAGVRWQNFSNHDEFDIRIFGPDAAGNAPEWYPRYRGMRDVMTFEAGAERLPGTRLRYGARARLETGATAAEAVTPLQVGGVNLGLAVGAELRLSNRFVLAGSYGFTWFPRVDVTDSLFDPRDHIACVSSDHAIDQCAASAQGRALPTAQGAYTRLGHAIRLSLRYDLL